MKMFDSICAVDLVDRLPGSMGRHFGEFERTYNGSLLQFMCRHHWGWDSAWERSGLEGLFEEGDGV